MLKRIFQKSLNWLVTVTFLYFAIRLLHWCYETLTSPQTDKALALAVVTSSLGLAAVLIQKHLDKKREIEFKLREKKVEAYSQLFELFFDFLKQAKKSEISTGGGNEIALDNALSLRFVDIARSLILWGSDDVLRKYSLFRTAGRSSPKDTFIALGNLLLEVRKDLGHANRHLAHVDLFQVFINDVDKLEALLSDNHEQHKRALPIAGGSSDET